MIPPKGSKVKYLNFAISKAIVNIFAEILHTGRAAIDMKHMKRDFSLKAWVRACWVDLGGGAEVKIKLFQNMVMLHIKLKLTTLDAGSNMVANILPTDTPSTQGVGSKGQTLSFSESSHVAYQIKAYDAGSTMKANMLSFTHTNDPWGGVKRSFSFSFIKVVMLHIK